MSLTFLRSRALIVAQTLLVLSPIASTRAQESKTVTLALVQRLDDSTASATIVREAGANARSLILMREDRADAALVATAMTALSRLLERHKDWFRYEVVLNLRRSRPPSALTSAELRLGTDYVSRLRNTRILPLRGVGMARALSVPLGPSRLAGGA